MELRSAPGSRCLSSPLAELTPNSSCPSVALLSAWDAPAGAVLRGGHFKMACAWLASCC